MARGVSGVQGQIAYSVNRMYTEGAALIVAGEEG